MDTIERVSEFIGTFHFILILIVFHINIMGGTASIPSHPDGQTMSAIVFPKYGAPEVLQKTTVPKVGNYSVTKCDGLCNLFAN